MKFSWENIHNSGTSIAFLASPRNTLCPESLGTPERGLLLSNAGEKNGLWRLWSNPLYLLRPKNPLGSRPALRGDADLSGRGDSPSRLSKVQESEAGEAGLVGRLSVQHQTICLLCWPSLPGFEYSGCRRRAASGLADGQGPGNTVHAGAIASSEY